MKNKFGFRLFFLLILCMFWQLGCPGVEHPNCKTDSQCKSDGKAGVCVFGKCQECAKDSDCAVGQQCQNNMCVQACTSDVDCDSASHCEAGFCKANCDSDESCADGEFCYNNHCMTKVTCSDSSDCDDGFSCESSLCVQQTTMSSNASCQAEGVVFFDFDKYNINADGTATLDAVAICFKENPSLKLLIAGHTDNRGTTEYNMSLGERRAKAAANYLTNMGVDLSHLRVISYGKEKPVDMANTEAGWAANRRSEISVEK